MQKIIISFFIWTAFLGLILSADSYAQEEEFKQEEPDRIELFIGQIKSFNSNNPKRVAIGNPEIADIANVSEKEITVAPKAAGRTTFFYLDDQGEHSFKLHIMKEDLNTVKERIDNVLRELNLRGVKASLVKTEDKVFLKGRLKSENEREGLYRAIGDIRDMVIDFIQVKEEETIVDIAVEVVEVSRDQTKTLGFTLPTSVSVTEPAGAYSTVFKEVPNVIYHVFDWKRTASFTAQLDAAIQQGKARVLSQPRLACQSGKEAELLVGGEKPVFTTQVAATTGAQATNIEYKEFGIKLKIKPTVIDERIKVGLNIDVSEVGTSETIGSSGAPTAKAFPLNKRSVQTEVFLNNGETLAIGGLVKQKEEEDITKVAFFGDIPILGLLFRKKVSKTGGGSGERGNVELIVLLTPKIVSTGNDYQADIREENSASRGMSKEAAMSYYADAVKRHILNNFVYPQFAKDAGYQGTVKLALYMSSAGQLLEVKIKSSSGYNALDDYAAASVRKISSYPSFPSTIDFKNLWVEVPIVYQLD